MRCQRETRMRLPTRALGKNGPQVNRLGFGLMGLSTAYGKPKSDNERMAVLDALYQSGQHFWDTADVYSDNEDLIGRWFAKNPEKRDKIFLATKFAGVKDAQGSVSINAKPEYVKQACETSLKRLGVSHIDLYYCHRLDHEVPVEKTVEAMAALKARGLVKYIGLSECSAESLRRAHKVHPITAVQIEYSPFSLEIEHPDIQLMATCRELGVAIVAYSPLGRGLLTGKYRSPDDFDADDFRRYVPRFSKENFPRVLQLADRIDKLAKSLGDYTAAQLTLAWALAQGDDVFPIPGTTSIARMHENLKALEIVVDKKTDEAIRKAAKEADVVGERYPVQLLSTLFADTPSL